MILVDTSVMIDYLRRKDKKLLALFGVLPLAVCGAVRAEVLAGARSGTDRNKLIGVLDNVAQVPIPDSIWDTLGDNLAAWQAVGLTVPFADALIATVGMANGIEVWARDRHFPTMQKTLPRLKLFQEPP